MFGLNKQLLHHSPRRLRFSSSPKALPVSPSTKPRAHDTIGEVGKGPQYFSLRIRSPAKAKHRTEWRGSQPVTQALHLPKLRLQHAHALLPVPLAHAPHSTSHSAISLPQQDSPAITASGIREIKFLSAQGTSAGHLLQTNLLEHASLRRSPWQETTCPPSRSITLPLPLLNRVAGRKHDKRRPSQHKNRGDHSPTIR